MLQTICRVTTGMTIREGLSKELCYKLNYTLYKNAGFWLVNSRDIFLQIQASHCEFAVFLLHVGVFA